MLSFIKNKIKSFANDKSLRAFYSIVGQINNIEPEIKELSDGDLFGKTAEFKQRLKNGESLEDILVPAFAVVRETSSRKLNMRHFDVQLLGGIILHYGMIGEIKTGEGKTLVATLAAYLNALGGQSVHIVTVNNYLAKRDASWMLDIYLSLGLSVGCIDTENIEDKRKAYCADIVYGTNNDFGFDYLRDNMQFSKDCIMQRSLDYAIIDEVDSILIDEARTPLIISGPTKDNVVLYGYINKLVRGLDKKNYIIDEEGKNVSLTEGGMHEVEGLLKEMNMLHNNDNLYSLDNFIKMHYVSQSLRAHNLFKLNRDYIIQDNQVVIIDEFTGRMMPGRRYSDGLHQALEAKEGLQIRNENQTLASITFQNYFRLYSKISGMTGTASTESEEFFDIYNLKVVEVPTNVPVNRIDHDDDVYRTADEKNDAIVKLIKELHKKGQPVLLGTTSISKSEYFSSLLLSHNLKHIVLNAKHHEKEASIIAQAGSLGSITITTNMAGRGTDIQLGGNAKMFFNEYIKNSNKVFNDDELGKLFEKISKDVLKNKEKVLDAGGLFVICSERNESRRVDNQLRGRSGRQGDIGASKFFISLEDDLMRIFGSDKISNVLSRLGLRDGESIQHKWINRSIAKAQQKIENKNYQVRKSILKFDDIMNQQRSLIFKQRLEIINSQHAISESFEAMREDLNLRIINDCISEDYCKNEKSLYELEMFIFRIYGLHVNFQELFDIKDMILKADIVKHTNKITEDFFIKKIQNMQSEDCWKIQKHIWLMSLDALWRDHLLSLDHLRQGIYLRAMGNKDPLVEYAKEAFSMFELMLFKIEENSLSHFSHLCFVTPEELEKKQQEQQRNIGIKNNSTQNARQIKKPSRNDKCPCGSGKKYKNCCVNNYAH